MKLRTMQVTEEKQIDGTLSQLTTVVRSYVTLQPHVRLLHYKSIGEYSQPTFLNQRQHLPTAVQV